MPMPFWHFVIMFLLTLSSRRTDRPNEPRPRLMIARERLSIAASGMSGQSWSVMSRHSGGNAACGHATTAGMLARRGALRRPYCLPNAGGRCRHVEMAHAERRQRIHDRVHDGGGCGDCAGLTASLYAEPVGAAWEFRRQAALE